MEVYFLAVADLCAAKLGAARSQDRRFVQALVDHRLPSGRPLVDLDEVDSAAATLSDNEGARTRAIELVDVLRRGGTITHPNLPGSVDRRTRRETPASHVNNSAGRRD